MKIAVTYDNGEVFQHFGHTENFKVYEVEDGKVVSSEIIASNCSGHDALAGFVKGPRILKMFLIPISFLGLATYFIDLW